MINILDANGAIAHDYKVAVCHVSATKMSRKYTLEDCRADHLARGWSDIGYHFFIDVDGVIHIGRSLSRKGAHVSGHNDYTVGICCSGGHDETGKPADTMNEAQKLAMESLLLALKKGNPEMTVKGHRDLSPDLNGDGKITKYEYMKECPCYNAMERFAVFNDPLQTILDRL